MRYYWFVFLLLLPLFLVAQEVEDTPKSITERLKNEMLALDFAGASTKEVFDFLHNALQMDFILTSRYLRKARRLDVVVAKSPLYDVLREIARATDGDFIVIHGAVVFGTEGEIGEIRRRQWPRLEDLPIWAQQIEKRLHSTPVSLHIEGVHCTEAMRFFRDCAKIKIVLSPRIRVGNVVLHVDHSNVADAFKLLCALYRLSYEYREGRLWITPYRRQKLYENK